MSKQPTLIQRLFGRRQRKPSSSPTVPRSNESVLVEGPLIAPPQTHGKVGFPNVEYAFRDWQIGDVILSQYEVRGVLGEGGMGKVYKVYNSHNQTIMAVKRPRPQCFHSQRDKDTFIREARTWINLAPHPHILRCFYVQNLEGIPCPFAEYIEGGSLIQAIRQRRLYEGGEQSALERILDIAIQFAWGLQAAHEQGLVHQDVKPHNVLLTSDGCAKVSDFGLAKTRVLIEARSGNIHGKPIVEGDLSVSGSGMTVPYCSPEQSKRRRLTRKTDIWSWGVSVLEMFIGKVTWNMGPLAAAVLQNETGKQSWAVSMPESVRELLRSCLQEDPKRRPATMGEVAGKLIEIYAQVIGRAYPGMVAPTETEFEHLYRLLERGNSLAALGRFKEALAVCNQAIQLIPSSSSAYAIKGNTLFRLGRYEEALAACQQALLLDPQNPGAFYNTSQVLNALGRYEEALVALEQTTKLCTSLQR